MSHCNPAMGVKTFVDSDHGKHSVKSERQTRHPLIEEVLVDEETDPMRPPFTAVQVPPPRGNIQT